MNNIFETFYIEHILIIIFVNKTQKNK